MQTGTLSRSRFQSYGLIVALMITSAALGALAALFFGAAAVSAPVPTVAQPAVPAAAPAVPVLTNLENILPGRDQLSQEQRDMRLLQRETQSALSLGIYTEAQNALEREMSDVKMYGRGVQPALEAAMTDATNTIPAVSPVERYRMLKERQIE